jgi:uncharacterized protein with ParB-like and HNH nuclease domain
MNALGTPLLPADLIKNFLIQFAEMENDKVEQLYEKYWKPFDKNAAF